MIFYLLGLLSYYRIAGKPVPIGICIAFFLVMSIPPVTALFLLLDKHWIFGAMAFIAGLFFWTYVEYFIHRFWLHRKRNQSKHNRHHFLHHAEPGKIFTTRIKRLLILIAAFFLTWASVEFNNNLLLPSGLISGYALYGYMHVWLHKHNMSHRFKKLRNFHLQHHAGQTEKCFGVTVTWWDHLFNTSPVSGKPININIKNLFFGIKKNREHNLSSKNISS